ncbi:hypothetical protein GF312_00270 [Candidatus Poribacteria bacterium]|nr:hypothetical protein [Candidatus Poribacteria bacterium]
MNRQNFKFYFLVIFAVLIYIQGCNTELLEYEDEEIYNAMDRSIAAPPEPPSDSDLAAALYIAETGEIGGPDFSWSVSVIMAALEIGVEEKNLEDVSRNTYSINQVSEAISQVLENSEVNLSPEVLQNVIYWTVDTSTYLLEYGSMDTSKPANSGATALANRWEKDNIDFTSIDPDDTSALNHRDFLLITTTVHQSIISVINDGIMEALNEIRNRTPHTLNNFPKQDLLGGLMNDILKVEDSFASALGSIKSKAKYTALLNIENQITDLLIDNTGQEPTSLENAESILISLNNETLQIIQKTIFNESKAIQEQIQENSISDLAGFIESVTGTPVRIGPMGHHQGQAGGGSSG